MIERLKKKDPFLRYLTWTEKVRVTYFQNLFLETKEGEEFYQN